ncbi:MAG: PSD1 domain-containing protein [Candidatus Hydrogenedentes bacterium]|nr:PSD1 domain-containing protein [Candidatus Hydrogenedentota bacterium]
MRLVTLSRKALLLAACVGLAPSLAHGGFYNTQVKPILSQHCFTCHGPDAKQRKGDLRLDIAPADSGDSPERLKEVFSSSRHGSAIFDRVSSADPEERMPPVEKPGLSTAEIEILGLWLDQGAPYEKHWAFVPPEWPEVPTVTGAEWARGPIDRFVLARLESKGIAPSPPADPVTAIRRLYLDLIGIPPSPEEVEAFTSAPDDTAWEAAVDALLASPHFGERWGRRWLDQARYADSNGYSIDGPRTIWPYRDWVINAFNEDKPFDQFVREQIAGDLLPDATATQKVATGFNRNTMINQEGGIDKEEFRIEAVVDRVNTTGSVFLGLTLGCAKCHDHKYDPIYQKDYFQLFAFYNGDDEVDLELPTPEQAEQLKTIRAAIDTIRPQRDAYKEAALRDKIGPWATALTEEQTRDWGLKEKAALALPVAEWTAEQRGLLEKRFLAADAEFQAFEKAIADENAKVSGVNKTMVLERRTEPRVTNLFIQGDFTRKGDIVSPATPAVLHPMEGSAAPTRLDLAEWLVARNNPLTARVTVNRFWQDLFGRGIVETENDFGYQGALPTHPEMLDYLANQFIARGGSMKSIIREIVLSSTYRQASRVRPELDTIDPRNYLLARQNRVRLDAELIRDAALTASAQLDRRIGGPSVFPPLPDGVMKLGQSDNRVWETSTGPDRFRRGMYTYFWRATPHSSLVVFDAPDALVACTRRTRSNTPLQALTLLNDQAYVEHAQALARRITEAPMASDGERLDFAFRVCLSRAPAENEKAILSDLLAKADPAQHPEKAWTMVARTLLNLDEFITRE